MVAIYYKCWMFGRYKILNISENYFCSKICKTFLAFRHSDIRYLSKLGFYTILHLEPNEFLSWKALLFDRTSIKLVVASKIIESFDLIGESLNATTASQISKFYVSNISSEIAFSCIKITIKMFPIQRVTEI